MKRYILTGVPGAGKTTILSELARFGFATVSEAATDAIADLHAKGIAEPWTRPSFIDDIVGIQRQRVAACKADIQFHDRSAFCTLALAEYLDFSPSANVLREVDRLLKDKTFQACVYFIANLGFVTATEARRITFEESLRFEEIHREIYRRYGFELLEIPAAPLNDRVEIILDHSVRGLRD